MKKDGNELCYSCHPKDKLGLSKAHVHTAVKSGACVLCHNPHASQCRPPALGGTHAGLLSVPRPGGLRAEGRPQGRCRRTGAPPAIRRTASDQPNLLVKEEKALCLGCHAGDRAGVHEGARRLPGRSGLVLQLPQPPQFDAARLLKTSVHAPVAGSQCDTCHVAPTSAKPFAVNQKGAAAVRELPRRRRHEGHGEGAAPAVQGRPVPALSHARMRRQSGAAQGARATASAPPATRSTAAARRVRARARRGRAGVPVVPRSALGGQRAAADGGAGALCLSCHAKTKEAVQKSKTPHAPAAADECTACHDAHGSNVKGILNDRADRVCYGCHTDAETKFTKTYTHAPVREGACASCHQPHGSDDAGLLKAAGAKLCESCHADLMKPIEGGASARPVRRGDVPHLPRPARQQRQGHGGGQPRHAVRGVPRRRQGRASTRPGRSTSRRRPASARRATTRTRRPSTASCWRRARTCASQLPQGAQGGHGRRGACIRRPRGTACGATSPTRPARDRLMAKPVRTLCAECHDIGTAGLQRRAPGDRPGAHPLRALPRRARVEGAAASSRATPTRRSP